MSLIDLQVILITQKYNIGTKKSKNYFESKWEMILRRRNLEVGKFAY